MTVEEVDRLAVACDKVSRRDGDYVRLAAFLGLRAGELTALQVGDVDLTLGVVTIRRAFSAGECRLRNRDGYARSPSWANWYRSCPG